MFQLQVLVIVQQDDIANETTGCLVFIITYFHSLSFMTNFLMIKNNLLN